MVDPLDGSARDGSLRRASKSVLWGLPVTGALPARPRALAGPRGVGFGDAKPPARQAGPRHSIGRFMGPTLSRSSPSRVQLSWPARKNSPARGGRACGSRRGDDRHPGRQPRVHAPDTRAVDDGSRVAPGLRGPGRSASPARSRRTAGDGRPPLRKGPLIGSASALRGMKRASSYSAARGAHSPTSGGRRRLAPHNVQVNAIAQNFVDNPTYFPAEVQANPRFQERLGARFHSAGLWPRGRTRSSRRICAAPPPTASSAKCSRSAAAGWRAKGSSLVVQVFGAFAHALDALARDVGVVVEVVGDVGVGRLVALLVLRLDALIGDVAAADGLRRGHRLLQTQGAVPGPWARGGWSCDVRGNRRSLTTRPSGGVNSSIVPHTSATRA